MFISYGAIAGLIAAVAFLIFVCFMIPVLVRTAKTLKEVNATMKTTNESIAELTTDVAGLMRQSSDLLDKTNDLLADVNDKMKTVEPVVQAAADLGESVSEINASSKKMAKRFGGLHFGRTGLIASALTTVMARRKRRKGEE